MFFSHYDYGFRDYSPISMRFTTVDPIRSGQNWYAYVSNDPVNKIDPFGLIESDSQATLKDKLGSDSKFVKDVENFTGVVGQGDFASVSAIGSYIVETGTAYVAENGIVTEQFDYKSTSLGAESNVGAGKGKVITVLPDGGKDDFLGDSTTGGGSAGAYIEVGASNVFTSSKKSGYSVEISTSVSVIPFSVAGYSDSVVEVK